MEFHLGSRSGKECHGWISSGLCGHSSAAEAGKGRVVVLGDASWMEPDVLVEGEKGKLLVNFFTWLAGGDMRRRENGEMAAVPGKYSF